MIRGLCPSGQGPDRAELCQDRIMFELQLESTARALVAPGKGILAADESTGTIEKRFKAIGVSAT